MTRGERLGRVTVAIVIGWVAGIAATFPLELAEVLRNSGGDWKLTIASLALGLMVWAMWTLGMAAVGWIVVGLPVALFVRPRILTDRPVLTTVISGLVGLGFVAVQFRVWTTQWWTGSDYLAIRLYGIFLTVFAAATAWAYIRLLRRGSRVRITVPA
jgi:hypothetical protein